MPTVSAPASPVIAPPAAQPTAAADATAPAGATHDGRRVAAGGAQSPITPAVASRAQAPSASPARAVTAAFGETVNQPGELRPPDPRRASLLQRLAQYIRDGVSKLVARLTQRGDREAGAPTPASAGSGQPATLAASRPALMADASRRACPLQGESQVPFAEGELEVLQQRVDAFADVEARSAAPEPEPAVGEYLGFPEETIEWMKEHNQPAAAQDKLPKNFNAEEFVARLDQELAMQDGEIRRHEQLMQEDPALARDEAVTMLLKRMCAERDARRLTRAEALAGRNPLPALYAQAGKLDATGDRDGAAAYAGWARKAFADTAEYLAGSGNEFFRNVRPERVESLADLGIADIEEVELMILDGKTPRTVDFRGLSRQWTEDANRSRMEVEQMRPQNRAEGQREADLSDVEAYIMQGVTFINQGRDPRPELLRHAQNLENKQYEDGVRLTREPQQLRAMVAQYEALLQENLGYRAGTDWLDRVRSLREAAE